MTAAAAKARSEMENGSGEANAEQEQPDDFAELTSAVGKIEIEGSCDDAWWAQVGA